MNEPTTPTSNWRDLIKVHPVAEMFPLMSPEELHKTAEDIKARGLIHPVTTWVDKDGTEWLIDGRNRLDAMAAAGYSFKRHGQLIMSGDRKGQREPERFKVVPPKGVEDRWALSYVRPYHGSDPYSYSDSANIKRRHLSKEDQKRIAAELVKADPARSDRSIAKEVGLSPTTVGAIETSSVQTGQLDQEPPKRVGRDGKARKVPEKGRKERKKATKDQQPAEPAASAPAPKTANVDGGPAIVEAQDQPVTLQFSLSDLPFDAALVEVKQWFAELPISQQSLVLQTLETANELETAMGDAEVAQPEDEPALLPPVEEPSDRVSSIVAWFNALTPERQKWCRDKGRLDKPKDQINHLKSNANWGDVRDWFTSLVAASAEDQAAVRTQLEAAMGDVEAVERTPVTEPEQVAA